METQQHYDYRSEPAIIILLQKLEEAKQRNPQFSLRAFAKKLGLSSGQLSEILNGKRTFTPLIKKKIAERLMLSPQETLDFFGSDLPGKMKSTPDNRLTLSQDQFHLISEWWYFALLCLAKTKNFKNRPEWMSKRLGLSLNIVKEAWDRLFRLGYLEKKGQQIVQKQPNLKTTDNLLDLSIRKSHVEDLKIIENSLLEVPLELRDNTSCTFIIDKEDLPKAKEMIRIFQNQFLNQIGKETGDEVYKLSVALYPLTQVMEKS